MGSFGFKEKLIFDNNRGQTFEISVLSPFFLDDAEGLDSMRNEFYTMRSYDEDGVSEAGSNVQPRPITIQGRISEEQKQNRAKMIRFFNPNHTFTLQYTNGEITRYIRCKVEKTPVINKEVFPDFLISLICHKPWWYGKEVRTDIASWISAFEFPLEIPQETGIEIGYRQKSLIVNIINTSDNAAPVRVEFKALGTVKNPSILNVETQEKIVIKKDMVAGDIITINTEKGNEYVELFRNGETTNIFNDLTIESDAHLTIEIGDNFYRYDAELNADNLEVSLYYTPQYVGV
ncbi:TPA: phage tail domain-containing protein [Bacillus luti]